MPAFVQEKDFGAGGKRVGDVVRGEDSLDAVVADPGLQALKQGVAGGAVEGGKGFVKQKQARRGGEGAGEGNALGLTAGEVLGTAVSEFFCAGKGEHFAHALGAGGGIEFAKPEGDVGGDVEVREERGLLRDEGGLAAAGFDPDFFLGFGEKGLVEGDVSAYRLVLAAAVESGEQAEEGAFAGAGGTEDHGPFGDEAALDL